MQIGPQPQLPRLSSPKARQEHRLRECQGMRAERGFRDPGGQSLHSTSRQRGPRKEEELVQGHTANGAEEQISTWGNFCPTKQDLSQPQQPAVRDRRRKT